MTSAEIRQSFLDFFKSKAHTIVPSSSLMPDSPNLLFTNAGMNQFVPIFLAQRAPDVSRWPGSIAGSDSRAADTQKCIRAGGKHNDLKDVGLDTYHHTFFEMLGNWSFGDYFKKEAIDWAWELITEVWKFPKNRLYATVYAPDKSKGDPSAFDQEAHDFWAAKFAAAGLDPKVHIVNGNKDDNFWMMGETGPCGPCSEIHFDVTPKGDSRGKLVNQGSAQCIEIWNLVFIQFNANPDGTFTPLPAKHVDTGMGFERVTSFIQGTKQFTDFNHAVSNYETDIFRTIFDKIEQLSGKRYASTLPAAGSTGSTEQEKIDVAFRVIADHIRTLSFAIGDGIQPSNEGRGFVLRRILRRAVRYGRTLGFHEPFFYKLVDVLAQTMGHVFPEVRSKCDRIEEVIQREEQSFNRTLDRGLALFEAEIAAIEGIAKGEPEGGAGPLEATLVVHSEAGLSAVARREQRRNHRRELARQRSLSGEAAFVLSDTYGFPFDLTQLLARERGFAVEENQFKEFVEKQKELGREDHEGRVQVIELSQIDPQAVTQFSGYDSLQAPARVLQVVEVKGKTAVIVNVSPLYAEMGGQVGDTGEIKSDGKAWHIDNTQKSGNAWLHFISSAGQSAGPAPAPGSQVILAVDSRRRSAIQRHHTGTHLLHWALHEVVSTDSTQKGSYVGPDKLTFDFSSAALTPQQVSDIEQLVNERILENAPVSWTEIKYSDVKGRKDIMQFFGDKYGEQVRVVQIGGNPTVLDGYSMELCGGTHTRATGEIGLFRIVGESAVAAGVRRIEAVSGLEAYRQAVGDIQLIRTLAAKVNSPVGELEKKIESLLSHQKDLEKQLRAAQQKQAAETARDLVAKAQSIGATRAIIENMGAADADLLQSIADSLKGQFQGVVVLGGATDGAVSLVATVAADLTKQIQAGKIIQTIAPIVGGKGGGRPDNARGGGKEIAKLGEALAKAKSLVESVQ